MTIDHDFERDYLRSAKTPGYIVWTCKKCDSTVEMPPTLTERAINQAMANKFACIPEDQDDPDLVVQGGVKKVPKKWNLPKKE